MRSGPAEVDEERLAQAEAFLQEAVYRSRETQAGALQGGANCGLGEGPSIDLSPTPKAAELLQSLFPGSNAVPLEHLRRTTAAWIERQDAFDRRRNHFLRDFRKAHGADRKQYDADQSAQFEQGLERINAEALAARRAAAEQLLRIPA